MRNKKPNSISIITLGCSKNVVDSEVLMNQIQANNIALVDDPSEAEILLINTCGFIEAAKTESINTILEASAMKRAGTLKKIYVAGCLSERYRPALQETIPEVDKFFGVTDFEKIILELGGDFKRELLGERHLTTPSHFAYLKISEGCDNPCSFCAIPIMRGRHVSKPIEDIVHEATSMAKSGVKEIILIGQDTTFYGLDRYGKRKLAEVLERITEIDGVEWVRIMYAFPSQFPRDVLRIINDNPKLCKYIDIPVQHIADDVLRSMRRGISRRATIDLIKEIRDAVPSIALRTTLIVGYPDETEKDFEMLCEFIRDTRFDRLGVFTYSVEEDTTAEPLGDPVPMELKERRRNEIMEIQRDISFQKNLARIGSIANVILDRTEGEYVVGRTEWDAPEVDNEVLIQHHNRWMPIGSIIPARITDAEDYDLFAEIMDDSL